jgi:TonB family protein
MSQPFTNVTALNAPAVSAAAQLVAPRFLMALIPALLGVAWLCGFITVLGYWCVQWRRIAKVVQEAQPLLEGREIEALRRIERTAKTPRRIAILSSRDSMEPGLCGIAHPVLLWPEGISPHLDDAHLEAVLAHEVCHVQHRDNLTSVVHMLVEAIFWFHPLVWWMERRLVEERERACDESVLEFCSRPQVYAESLLKVCEFCVESPLTCISGITGADLKRRIGQIMTASIARKRGLGARLFLLAAGLVAVSVPIMLGQMKGARVVAAVKASERAEAGAVSFAARVASPIELESTTPSNTLIASPAVREFQLREPVNLAQAEAPVAPASPPRSPRTQFNRIVSAALDGPVRDPGPMHGLITWSLPGYPPEAKAAGIQGMVALNVTITKTGTVENVQVVSGLQELRQSAIDTVKQWQFKPYLDNGTPVEGETIGVLYSLPRLAGMVGPVPPADEAAAGVKQYGGDVTTPAPIYEVHPEYTELARTDKVEGAVSVSLVVDEHGVPQHVQLARGLGDGLDEKAIGAVKQYRFRPAKEKDTPVAVFMYLEVNFKLN